MLLFMDGMAHYDSSRIGMKYSTKNDAFCTWSIAAEGRFGNCLKRVSTSNSAEPGYVTVSPLTTRLGAWAPTPSGVCGFAFKVDDLSKNADLTPSSLPGNLGLFTVGEGSIWHLTVSLNTDGTLSLWGNNVFATLLAVSSEAITSGTWMYVEFKWLIGPTAGTFQIRVNGILVMDFTGNTQEQQPGLPSLGVWNMVQFLRLASEPGPPWLTVRMCDLYLADLAAADPDDVHDFLGDGIIDTIMPNGVGASSAWTPTGAAANWDTQNDRPAPDDDGTYARALAPGAKDTYQFEDIPTGSIVKGAHVCILARKEDEGSSAIAPVVRQGSTDYVGPTQGVASIAYDRYVTQPYDLNPATLAPWTDAEINAGQFGVQKVT